MTENDRRRIEAVVRMRSWIGTRFQHQGRIKGRGVDCVGLVLAAAREVGAITPEQEDEIPNYHRLPAVGVMQAYMERHLLRVTLRTAKPLDIILVPICGRPMHLGLLTDYAGHGGVEPPFGLLHAQVNPGLVLEQRFEPAEWPIRRYFRFPELAEPDEAA